MLQSSVHKRAGSLGVRDALIDLDQAQKLKELEKGGISDRQIRGKFKALFKKSMLSIILRIQENSSKNRKA